jgi:hypothetical protein
MTIGLPLKDNLEGQLDYPPPAGIDRPLKETTTDKVLLYRADYNNRPSLLLEEFSFPLRLSKLAFGLLLSYP